MEDRQIKEILISKNEGFKHLSVKHQECERRLNTLNSGNIRTDKEWLEVHDLKKQKLKLKDSMQKYILEYRKHH